MSVFNKRRKIVRQKQEDDRKRWDESSKRQEKSFDLMIKITKHMCDEHPEYESLDPEERLKLFAEYQNKYKGEFDKIFNN